MYHFIEMSTGKEVELDLPFEFVFENQKHGLLSYKGNLYRRNIGKEISQEKKVSLPRRVTLGPKKRVSVAAGVHPDQVPEAREHFGKVHSGIEFHANGDVQFSSRGARRAFLKASGMRDNNGGYGDG